MNRIKEIFGVEPGEKFDIYQTELCFNKTGDIEISVNEAFRDNRLYNCSFNKNEILHVPYATDFATLIVLTELITGEAKIIKHKKPILDDVEKRYLGNIIKPFKVEFIAKIHETYHNRYYICIKVEDENPIYLPYFPADSEMYKGMKEDKEYTPEELGL